MTFLFSQCINAQWVNNPQENTKLVMDVFDPVNISCLSDEHGGLFVFWQDNKLETFPGIYFIHADGTGKISFRADGKKVTSLNGRSENPVATYAGNDAAVILWKDFTKNQKGVLYAQKVLSNGSLLWGTEGIQINNPNEIIIDYTITVDQSGNILIAYIAQSVVTGPNYKIVLRSIGPDGNSLLLNDEIELLSSPERKSAPVIICHKSGYVSILWLETGKSGSYIKFINSDFSQNIISKPVKVTDDEKIIFNYQASSFQDDKTFISYQVQNEDKDICNQLIDKNGNVLWPVEKKNLTRLKGDQTNPRVLCENNLITVSWTQDSENGKDIYIKRFDSDGRSLWNEDGLPVINFKGDQFGQRMISDGKNGVLTAWIDRRIDSTLGNIYAQRIDSNGNPLWDSAGVAVGSHHNSLKSYLHLLSDYSGGAVAVFKDSRGGINEIYGQKIFSSGTFISQIIGFEAKPENDSINISWYTANESGMDSYIIERSDISDTGKTIWVDVAVLNSLGKNNINFYSYKDQPDKGGTLYYRVQQKTPEGNSQYSGISRVIYFSGSSSVIVAQNIPNPFSDSTTISFFLPDENEVEIEFFNSHIEKIEQINRRFPAGGHEIVFDATDLETGIYFYRFRVNDFVDVKKMVISR
ncbi:MAG: hypothetical protein Kow0098_21750 [Ignavibacteriaceae bacterium]